MMMSRLSLMSLASVVAIVSWTPSGLAQEKPIRQHKTPQPAPPIPATAPDSMTREFRAHSRRVPPPPPAVSASPSLGEVIETLRRLPGGPQRLERARRSGAAIPSAGANADDAFRSVATDRGPSISDVALNTTAAAAMFLPPIEAKVTRRTPSVTVAGVGRLIAEANYPAFATYADVWGPLDRISYAACPVGGSCVARSWVMIYLNAESTGWYLINVQATPIAAQLRMASGGSAGYTLVTNFPYPTTAGYSSYPVLLYLSAGSHTFSWVNLDFFPYVSEVSVWRL